MPKPVAMFNLDVRNAYELPNVCAQVIEKLQEQPLFTGQCPIPSCKLLLARDDLDARIMELFAANVLQRIWKITRIKDQPVIDTRGVRIEKGVILNCDNRFHQIFFFGTPESSFEDVFSSLSDHWKKSEETSDFEIFTKRKILENEDDFIHTIAKKFALSEHIQCSLQREMISIKIRKSEKAQICEKIGLSLSSSKSI